jgi:hypothetical protein
VKTAKCQEIFSSILRIGNSLIAGVLTALKPCDTLRGYGAIFENHISSALPLENQASARPLCEKMHRTLFFDGAA